MMFTAEEVQRVLHLANRGFQHAHGGMPPRPEDLIAATLKELRHMEALRNTQATQAGAQ